MSKPKSSLRNYSRLLLSVIIIVALIHIIRSNSHVYWNIFKALMGFSAVVFIHECGHFIVAKLSDIKVETFSIFLSPILFGVRKTEEGFRFRILPAFFPKENDELGDGMLSFTLGRKGKAGETEYRMGLIPIAGYVKMLGQEDTGPDKETDDPRAFSNKPIRIRMAVAAAGVLFNVIAAVGILAMVYMIGINRTPAIVGGVVPDSPAAHAGLRAGDEILQIDGRNDQLDFGNLLVAAVLSGADEKIPLTVRHEDGSIEDYEISSEYVDASRSSMRRFGIIIPANLTVAQVSAPAVLFEQTKLKPNDQIKSVAGQDVQTSWQMSEIIENTFAPAVDILVQRFIPDTNAAELVKTEIPLTFAPAARAVKNESDLSHIFSMVPRLKVTSVLQAPAGGEHPLKSGDIILSAGYIENPTYKELRNITTEYEDKELAVKVLRMDAGGEEKTLTVKVTPTRPAGSDRVMIGIGVGLDTAHTVVAKAIAAENGPEPLKIPRGAKITAVDTVEVADFHEVISQIKENTGQRITLDWRLDENIAGDVVLDLTSGNDFVSVKSSLATDIPLGTLERLYKADGPIDALVIGCRKSVWFIVQTYATLRGLLARNISPQALSGPVGIAAISYEVVERSAMSFMYLLAFISANLAVINFLPIPVVDGGMFVLLILEKFKGSPLSIRSQEVITYAGLVLIASAFLYLTYNDIINLIR